MTKKHSKIKIVKPELVWPYSPTYKPFPPLEINDACECPRVVVNMSAAFVPYILGALELFRWADAFTGTDDEKQRTVGLFRDLMGVFAMASRDCGCDDGTITIHRINPITGEYEQSTDGGETWETSPDSPYVQATRLPPIPGTPSEQLACEAANNVVYQLKLIQERWSAYIGTIDDFTQFLFNLALEIAALLFLPLAGQALAAVIQAIANKIFEEAQKAFRTTPEQYDAMFTPQVWEDALCILRCAILLNGTFDEQGLSEVKSRFNAELNFSPDSAGDSLAAMVNFLGVVGLNNAASIAGEENAPCDDCQCANCSNLSNWVVLAGTIEQQEPGLLRVSGVPNGQGGTTIAISSPGGDVGNNCCAVSYDFHASPITNTAYIPCGQASPVVGIVPQGGCMWDVNFTDIFGRPIMVTFTFTNCP